MTEWAVQPAQLNGTAQTVARCKATLEQISSELNSVNNAINRQCHGISASQLALFTVSANVRRQSTVAGDLSAALQQISQKYQSVENDLCNGSSDSGQGRQAHERPGAGNAAWVDSPVWKDATAIHLIADLAAPDWTNVPALKNLPIDSASVKKYLIDMISKAGPVGAVIKTLISGAKIFEPGGVWKNLANTTLSGLKSLKAYTSVGAAEGVQAKWAAALGFDTKDLWKNSFAQNVGGTFKESMKGSFTTPLGLGIVGATAVVEGFENYEEYKSGKISAGRAVAETVLETGTKVVMAAGAKAIATGVIGAICGTVGAPAVAVGVGAVAVTWLADGVCKWATGLNGGESRGLDEFVADTVVDGAKKAVDWASNAAKDVGDFAHNAAEGVKTGWKTVCSWFS